jgi:Ala-tRNA(Pro) deacylase
MAIAQTLITYLQEKGIRYDLVAHAHTETAVDSAHAANVPPHQVAKAVVMCDDAGYVVSVLPANHSLEIGWVNEALGRKLELACEKEFNKLFADCAPGAVPALGEAYGVEVIWDDELAYTSDIFIEAGDHEHLIWLGRHEFKQLMSSLPHSIISKDTEVGCWKY